MKKEEVFKMEGIYKSPVFLALFAIAIIFILPATSSAQMRLRSIVAPKDGNVTPHNGTTEQDLVLRSPDLQWPDSFAPERSDLFAHNEIFIKASPAVVFKHLQEVDKWPDWYPNAANIKVAEADDGTLKEGRAWRWEMSGMQIENNINEFKQDRHIAWFSSGNEQKSYQVWHLKPTSDGYCFIVTEESVYGPAAISLRRSDSAAVHKANERWIENLKKLSEKE